MESNNRTGNRAKITAFWEKLLKGEGKHCEIEYRIAIGDKIKWIKSRIIARMDFGEKSVIVCGIDMDATQDKLLQDALGKDSFSLAKFHKPGHIGTWELNLKTMEVFASTELIMLYGLPEKETYNYDDFISRIHPEDRANVKQSHEQSLKDGFYDKANRLLNNEKTKWIYAIEELENGDNNQPKKNIATEQDITKAKESEKAVQRSEQQIDAILRAIPDMIFIINREGAFLDFIPGKGERDIIPSYRFIGKKIMEMFPPDMANKHLMFIRKALQTGIVQEDEYQLNVKGKNYHFNVRIARMEADKVVVMSREMTQQVKTLEDLHHNNEELKLFYQAVEQSPVSINIINCDGNIEYVNPYFTQVTGYTKEEVIGRNPNILKSGKQDAAFYKDLWDTILSGKIWTGEFHNKKKNGELFWEKATISPIFNEKQEITHFIAIKEDITQSRITQEKLQEMAGIVDSSEAIIIGKSLDGIIRSWNRGAERIYGYLAEEVIGLPIGIIIPKELRGELQDFANKIKIKKRVEQFETQRIRKDGSMVEVSISLSEIRDSNDNIIGISTVGQDISRQKQLERELREAREKAEEAVHIKGLFLANMSHEIRTPMNAILGFAEALAGRITDPALKVYLQSMQSSGRTLMALINDLLDFSKANAGKLELHEETADIRFIVHDIESIFRLKAEQKNLLMEFYISDEIPTSLYLDENRLRQVLLNLVSNAVKFTDSGKVKIDIKAKNIQTGSLDLLISVQDTGKGIDPQYHKKIFKLFEQQDSEISKRYGGTGLGLAISTQIVQLMHGTITLKSEEGKGSTFVVFLPKVNITGETIPHKPVSKMDTGNLEFEPVTILIVDDTSSNRLVLMAILEDFNFRFLEATNGQEALNVLEQQTVDLIFMDVRMPMMDGNKAVKKIRNNAKWSHIPVVALTASATHYEKGSVLKQGFDAYLRKPAGKAEIVGVLKKFLKNSEKENVKKEDFVLSKKAFANLHKLFSEIDVSVMAIWEQLQTIRPRKKVKALAELLIEKGENYEVEHLKRYGEDLMIANKNFLFEMEKELITGLPSFLKNLKNRLKISSQ